MKDDIPITRQQLRDALEVAVKALLTMRNMTGNVDSRCHAVDKAGFKIAEALNPGDVGWNPLGAIEIRLQRGDA
jgi:hypothetical protein